MHTIHFETDGLFCEICTDKVERVVGSMHGVSVVHANHVHGLTAVLYDPELVDLPQIAGRIESCGFTARPSAWHTAPPMRPSAYLCRSSAHGDPGGPAPTLQSR